MKVLKQNVGVDIAKLNFVSTFTTLLEGQKIENKITSSFSNDKKGMEDFLKWIKKNKDAKLDVHVTMEATGVYYESLAYFLYEQEDIIVHVLLPNTAKKYFESLNIKTKTDKVDSKILGRMGSERTLSSWELSSKIYRELRTLTREREQIVDLRTITKNQLHAEENSADKFKPTIKRTKKRIQQLDLQIKQVEADTRKKVESDTFVSEKIKKIETTPGLGFLTVVSVVAETGGFVNTKNINQLTSYSGYDVSIKESGNWNGKPKISKKGNKHIRRALHMPSLSAIRYSETYKNVYERINEQKEHKMIGIVAVQRKLLGLIYTLWKNNSVYIENYEKNKSCIEK